MFGTQKTLHSSLIELHAIFIRAEKLLNKFLSSKTDKPRKELQLIAENRVFEQRHENCFTKKFFGCM